MREFGKWEIKEVEKGEDDDRKFDSKSARAEYIQALITDKTQYPFLWECCCPGNIPVGENFSHAYHHLLTPELKWVGQQ